MLWVQIFTYLKMVMEPLSCNKHRLTQPIFQWHATLNLITETIKDRVIVRVGAAGTFAPTDALTVF